MKRRSPLWRISVATTAEAEDSVTELLQNAFSHPASSYRDAESATATVSVYLPTDPEPTRPRALLRRGLAGIRACGLNIGRGTVSIRRVRDEDWAESWKRHFAPIEIGSKLLVKPGWSRRRACPGQRVVVLDPGLSFGTGQHPTTAFCLRQLAGRRRPGAAQSLLDIGTGSGILAIAAAKLGYSPVEAIDLDPEAVHSARSNARHNRVADRIRFARADLSKLPPRGARKHDVVCANLISDLLIRERRRILARLKPAGALIVAGILSGEFPQVERAYASAGLRLVASRIENEWRSGAFAAGPRAIGAS